MARKQVDFDVISENIGNAGEKQILLGRVHKYLAEGWEVLQAHIPQTGVGALTVTVILVKYEDVPERNSVESVLEEVKRGPGRPKKEEVVPA